MNALLRLAIVSLVILFVPLLKAQPAALELPGVGFDLVVDEARHTAFVSIPETNQLVTIALPSMEVIAVNTFAFAPHGMDLSHDGNTLYVALFGSGQYMAVDLDTGATTHQDVAAELGDTGVSEVLEAKPGILYLAARTPLHELTYLARVDVTDGPSVTRVEPDRVRYNPRLQVSIDEKCLFVSENDDGYIWRFDIRTPPGERVEQRRPGVRLRVSPDDKLLVTEGGQLLHPEALNTVANIGPGFPMFGADPDICYMFNEGVITGYDLTTLEPIGSFSVPCAGDGVAEALNVNDGRDWLVLEGSTLCGWFDRGICDTPPGAISTPTPAEGTSDLDLATVLRWVEATGTCRSGYDVYIGTENPPSELVCSDRKTPDCYPGQLDANTEYFWQVVARNELGTTTSPVWQFSTRACESPALPNAASIPLPEFAVDMAYAAERKLLFVSLPREHQVWMISAQTFEVLDRLHLGFEPYGLDVSADERRLYVALNDDGGIATYDLDTRIRTFYNMRTRLGSRFTYDVLEIEPDVVLVTNDQGSPNSGFLVRFDLNAGTRTQVAGRRKTGRSPTLAQSADGSVYKCCNYDTWKLDTTQIEMPIVAMNDFGTDHFAVSPSGTRIMLRNGRVLDGGDLSWLGDVPQGAPTFAEEEDVVSVARFGEVIRYDIDTAEALGSFAFDCNDNAPKQLHYLSAEHGWTLLSQAGMLCYLNPNPVAPGIPADPIPPVLASDVATEVRLDWTNTDPCVRPRYDVYLDTQTPPVSQLCTDLQDTSCTALLADDQTYYWQVVAKGNGLETPGPIWSFTTRNCPVIPTPRSPMPPDQASLVGPRPELRWNIRPGIPGPGRPGPTTVSPAAVDGPQQTDLCEVVFDVFLGQDNPPTTLVSADHPAPMYEVDRRLRLGTTYYWQIVARGAAGEAAGPVWSFITECPDPNTASDPFPADNALDVPLSVSLDWEQDDPVPVCDDARNPEIEGTLRTDLGVNARAIALEALETTTVDAIAIYGVVEAPTSIAVNIRSVIDMQRGPLLHAAVADTTLLGEGFIEVPIAFTFEAGQRYDVSFRPAEEWGTGVVALELSFFNNQTMRPDLAYEAGPFLILDGGAFGPEPGFGGSTGYPNRQIPRMRFCFRCAASYSVTLGPEGEQPITVCEQLPQPGCQVDDLLPGTTYNWTVESTSCCGSATSPVWSFTTQAEPSPDSHSKVELEDNRAP